VKQLILRVSDDLHRRIAARAAREGKSVNAWAGELLDATADADVATTRQARAVARAAELGMLVTHDAPKRSPEERERGRRALAELAPDIVRIIEEDRSTGL
jgi:plasmid stability protein